MKLDIKYLSSKRREKILQALQKHSKMAIPDFIDELKKKKTYREVDLFFGTECESSLGLVNDFERLLCDMLNPDQEQRISAQNAFKFLNKPKLSKEFKDLNNLNIPPQSFS